MHRNGFRQECTCRSIHSHPHTGAELKIYQKASDAEAARTKKPNGFPIASDVVSVLANGASQNAMLLNKDGVHHWKPLREAAIACGGMLSFIDLGQHHDIPAERVSAAALAQKRSLNPGVLVHGFPSEAHAWPHEGAIHNIRWVPRTNWPPIRVFAKADGSALTPPPRIRPADMDLSKSTVLIKWKVCSLTAVAVSLARSLAWSLTRSPSRSSPSRPPSSLCIARSFALSVVVPAVTLWLSRSALSLSGTLSQCSACCREAA